MDFEKLYEAYYMRIYSFAVSLTRDKAQAEELAQHTFYKAASTTVPFRGNADVFTWLCAIAKNLYRDELRRNRRYVDIEELQELPSDESIERAVADADMAFHIHLILHQLEEPYKEVFQLRIFGELSFSQIATVFGKTETWARVTYHRAKLKIQERLEGKYE